MAQNPNSKLTYMTELKSCLTNLEEKGYTDEYKVENGCLHCLTSGRTFSHENVKAMNFYRFEGNSNPDDMSILFAIETTDGRKGTLIDAYGMYADGKIGDFMQAVEVHKKVHDVQVY
jgi:hypothetical protein